MNPALIKLMKTIGPILLSAIASLAACSDASNMGPDETKADLIDPVDVPILDAQYGVVVSSAMTVCKNGETPCPAEQLVEVSATLRGLVTIEQEEARVLGQLVACKAQVVWGGEKYNSADYLSLHSLGPIFRFDGDFVAGEEGPILQSGMAALLLGAELSDEVGEDFPTRDDDARTIDQDRDGKPGVSVKAPLGKVFLGARVILDFEAKVGESGALAGALNGHGFNISVYGDSIPIPFYSAKKKIKNALDPVTLLDQSHSIEFIPGAVDCAGVSAL